MSTNQPSCPGGTYTVKAGDSFWGIARAVGVSLDALQKANPGVDPNTLRVGQIICLPAAAPGPRTCEAGMVSYTIRAGDTLYELARANSTTVDAILKLNPDVDPNSLRVGEIICLPPSGATGPSTITCPAGLVRYTIRAGDTLWALAQQRGTTVDRILAQNPGLSANSLVVGRIICLPPVTTTPGPTTCSAGLTPYTIVAGDTLYAIARRSGTTVAAIQSDNPGIDPNSLRVGQIICIPPVSGGTTPGRCAATDRQYVVQSGDTFYRIAQKFGVSVAAIQGANPGVSPTSLVVGQIICVPSA